MIISTDLVHKSLATVAASIVPNSFIYDNPNQQGTHLPAWFIVHREPVRIERENKRRAWLIYGIDLYYMLELNTPRVFDEYAQVGDALDVALTYLPLYDSDVIVHVYERSWELAMNCLKYSLTLRFRVSPEVALVPKMQVIEDLRTFIKSLGIVKQVHYICSQFPSFDMGIEQVEYVYQDKDITLPVVSGIYRDSDGIRWEPLAWNVGQMGDTFGPVLDDMTINLFMGEVIGLDTCIGGTVGVGENVGKDIVWRIQGMTRTDWRASGPIRALETDAGVSGGADLSRDEWTHRGPVKAMTGEPVMGGTVEPYTPPPKYYTAYFNPGQGNNTKPDSSQWSAYGGTRRMYPLNSSSDIPYDSTKKYTVISVFYVDGTEITDSYYINSNLLEIDDKNYMGKPIGVLMFHYRINNRITGNPCGCTYKIREA